MGDKTTTFVQTTPFGVIKPPQGGCMPPKQKMTRHSKAKQSNPNQSILKSALCEMILILTQNQARLGRRTMYFVQIRDGN